MAHNQQPDTYDEAIRSAAVVLVEFYASWCPHCQRMMPVVEQVGELLAGRAAVVRLDIDQNKEAADAARVETIPTFIVYRDGAEQWRRSGEMSGDDLLARVEQYL